MKAGIVSFSLFGTDPNNIYHIGAIRQAELYAARHPEWKLWYYVGDSVPWDVYSQIALANPNAHLIGVNGEAEDLSATWWRYRAIKDCDPEETSFILFRDVDSRLNDREDAAVMEWLAQDEYPFHVIRDHQYHAVPLLAGLWGIQRKAFFKINLPSKISRSHYQCDQEALREHVWPTARRQIMVHVGCYHLYEKPKHRRPLTVPRGDSFVAEGFYGDDTPRFPEHRAFVDSDAVLLKNNPPIFLEEYVPRPYPWSVLR